MGIGGGGTTGFLFRVRVTVGGGLGLDRGMASERWSKVASGREAGGGLGLVSLPTGSRTSNIKLNQ